MRHEPFKAAEDAAVHHDRPLTALVGGDVVQVEPGWLVEVKLDGRQGRLPPGVVEDLYVDLRPVESPLSRLGVVGQPAGVEHPGEGPFTKVPHGRVVDVFLAVPAQREPIAVRRDAQAR